MIRFPTKEHEYACKKFVEIFSKDKRVKAILLTNSCAREKACKDSCLDIEVLINNIKNKEEFKKKIEKLIKNTEEFNKLSEVGKFSQMDVHFSDGKPKPEKRGWETGPDEFELEVGNIFIYSKVLYGENNFNKLRKKYIPYYSEKLRQKKLKGALMYMNNNLEHIPLYVKRGLYFAAFARFYNATKEFLQALFISKKIYPISYNKHIKEQLAEILKLPDLYNAFVQLYEIKNLESEELIEKAEKLKELANKYIK